MKSLFLSLLFSTSTLFGSTLVVDDDANCGFGICTNTCENGSIIIPFIKHHNYKTIIDAVNDANSNDIIKICKGNYSDTILLQKSNLTFTSGSDVTVPSDVDWTGTLTIHVANNIVIENISFSGSGHSIVTSNSKASVTNTCFFKSTSVSMPQTWDGNYWSSNDPYHSPYKNTKVTDSSPLKVCGGSASTPIPIANYKMDECSWNGTTDEVKDSSGNDYDGTAHSANTSSEAKINRAGDLSEDGDQDYVSLDHRAMNGLDDFSVSIWVKTANTSGQQEILQALSDNEHSNDNEFELYLDGDDEIHVNVKGNTGSGVSYDISSNKVTDNHWHQIFLTRHDKTVCVYVDANLIDCKTSNTYNSGALNIAENSFLMGQEQDSVGGGFQNGNQNFVGFFDELDIFDSKLTDAQISDIYNNENSGKNYDGTTRSPQNCVNLNQCYTDNFDRAELGDKWTIIKKKNYTPQIESNKMILTEKNNNIATGVTLSGKFPSADNYVEIEFEHNAYGNNGDGADGVTVALADASVVDPLIDSNVSGIAGAYGGSLGYAQRSGLHGFKGGWLGIGLDEYGNFSNPTEGREGGPGFKKDSVAIRGYGDGTDGYKYIIGTETLSPGIDSSVAQHYKYKISIDTRNSRTMLKVERDAGNGYEIIIDWYDVTQDTTSPSDFKFSLTGSTGGSINYHSLDDLTISAISCGTLGQEDNTTTVNYKFDAWDIAKDINNRTISTKKSYQNFDLSIASINETNDALQDYNGSVCVRIVNSSDKNLTSWEKLQFSNDDKLNATFNVTKADKNAKVQIVWKDNVTQSCPLNNETNSTKSTDNFAIRPDKFNLTLPTIGYAGENFSTDFDAGNVVDYNETLNSSFIVEANISKSNCFNGTLHVTPFSFENGLKNSVDINYSDVGDINITIKEKLGSEFAIVDKNDTSDSDRLIAPFSASMVIKPYELNVTNVEYQTGWLYMADVDDISQKVKFSVLANDMQHNLVKNFTDACYSKNVDVKTHFSVENTNNNVKIKYDNNTTHNISDINRTITIPKASFVNSKADVEYDLNIERDYKTPYEPIQIGLREVSIESSDIAKEENNVTVSLDRDFYYGRVKTEDLSTNKQVAPHSLHVEVYKLGKYKQNSLNWYVNEADTNTTMSFTPKTDFTYNTNKSGVSVTNIAAMLSGAISFDMTNSWSKSDSAMIHLDIPRWLWYSKYNSYDSVSDCSYHPCFEYRYIDADGTSGIQSGDFKGSTIGSDYNATKQKIGVKTFR